MRIGNHKLYLEIDGKGEIEFSPKIYYVDMFNNISFNASSVKIFLKEESHIVHPVYLFMPDRKIFAPDEINSWAFSYRDTLLDILFGAHRLISNPMFSGIDIHEYPDRIILTGYSNEDISELLNSIFQTIDGFTADCYFHKIPSISAPEFKYLNTITVYDKDIVQRKSLTGFYGEWTSYRFAMKEAISLLSIHSAYNYDDTRVKKEDIFSISHDENGKKEFFSIGNTRIDGYIKLFQPIGEDNVCIDNEISEVIMLINKNSKLETLFSCASHEYETWPDMYITVVAKTADYMMALKENFENSMVGIYFNFEIEGTAEVNDSHINDFNSKFVIRANHEKYKITMDNGGFRKAQSFFINKLRDFFYNLI